VELFVGRTRSAAQPTVLIGIGGIAAHSLNLMPVFQGKTAIQSEESDSTEFLYEAE
jgi:hypothetical protein